MKAHAFLVSLSVAAVMFVNGFGLRAAWATELPPYEVKADGTIYELYLSASEKGLTSVSVYFVTSAAYTSPAGFYLEGPSGLRASVRSIQLGKQTPAAALASKALWNKMGFVVSGASRWQDTVSITAEPDTTGTLNAYFHIQRDACTKNAKYLTQLTFDLSGIAPSAFDAGFLLKTGVEDYVYKGGRRASIKPESDGMYAPKPIVLMESLAYSGESINLVTWKGGRITKQSRIPVVKYVGYQGLGLSLALLHGKLNGGKASFDLTDGTNVYGACFALQRKRQSANGYPTPR